VFLKKEEIKRIADQTGMSEEVVSAVGTQFWYYLKESMRADDLPMIKVRYFGTFKPKYNRVKYAILTCIKNIREGKNPELYRKKLKRYWKARNELINSNQTKYYG